MLVTGCKIKEIYISFLARQKEKTPGMLKRRMTIEHRLNLLNTQLFSDYHRGYTKIFAA